MTPLALALYIAAITPQLLLVGLLLCGVGLGFKLIARGYVWISLALMLGMGFGSILLSYAPGYWHARLVSQHGQRATAAVVHEEVVMRRLRSSSSWPTYTYTLRWTLEDGAPFETKLSADRRWPRDYFPDDGKRLKSPTVEVAYTPTWPRSAVMLYEAD